MIIEINRQKVDVPKYKELAVSQYKKIIPFIAKNGGMDVLRYISLVTDVDYKKSLHFQVKGLNPLNVLLGTFKFVSGDKDMASGESFIETTPPPKYFTFDQEVIELSEKKVNAVGYRILLETFMATKPNYIDLYIFMCASILKAETSGFDYEEVMAVKDRLENREAYKVLTTGAFFFYKWKREESTESRLLQTLRRVLLTSTRTRSPKLVLIDYQNTLKSTK